MGADVRTPEAKPSETLAFVDWSGFHVGINASAGALFNKYTFSPVFVEGREAPGVTTGFGGNRRDTSVLAGGYLGYNWSFGPIVLGVEGDLEAASLKRTIGNRVAPSFGFADTDADFDLFRIKTDWVGSVRGRAGFSFGRFLIYATAGLAASNARVIANYPGAFDTLDIAHDGRTHTGYTAGAGFEAAISSNLSLGVEYRFSSFARGAYRLGIPTGMSESAFAQTRFTSHQVMARLSWFPNGLTVPSDQEDDKSRGDAGAAPEVKNWSLHGQSTFIQQALPGFHSPYAGPNSLLPKQARETWSVTGFLGTRLWEGAELYFNPETTQGFGPSGTLGLAGFSNGEAAKAGFTYPRFRPQRYFIRQTFGFGGEQEEVKDGTNQIAGIRDVNRLTITVGKLSVTDVFDDNAYAHDPRVNFLNAALWSSIAYDYPANLAGYTHGIVADLNQKDWAFRMGLFQVPKVAGSDTLDPHIGRGGAIAELEARYSLFSQPGKLRVGVFANRAFAGDYRDALADPDVNDGLAMSRRTRVKSGFYANAEQALTEDLGLFSRLSWNDGRTEIVSFTDVDASLSGGLALKGTGWGRPADVVGLGGGVNALVRSHRDYLAAGGLGLLIGDGRLRYNQERIFEAYYAVSLAKPVTLTFDYQFVANPAYNADRGPVSVFSARLHADF